MEWISKSANGQPAWGDSFQSSLSSDGRFVAFGSSAANLVPGDTNGVGDIFVVDRQQQTIERVSISSAGLQGNGGSGYPAISADGRFVAFVSASTNLDPGDPHPAWDIYLHDRQQKTTQLVSIHIGPPVLAFFSGARDPRISPDGRFVAFQFVEDIIVPGDVNGMPDVFLRDMQTGVTELISLDSNQVQSDGHSIAPQVSADGRYVAFLSQATNWYPIHPLPPQPVKTFVYIRDRLTNSLIPVNLNTAGSLGPGGAGDAHLAFSADGRTLVYSYGWANFYPWMGALLAHDLSTGKIDLIAHSIFGQSSSQTYFESRRQAISADGRFVVYDSLDKELVLNSQNKGGYNVFIHDRATALTQVASLGPNGQWPSIPSLWYTNAFRPAISADGLVISFTCPDPSFGSGNTFYNIYVRTCDWTQPAVYCAAQQNSLGCTPAISFSGSPSASAGSSFIVGVQGLVSSTFGFFFYSTRKPLIAPFQGGYLCMPAPIRRMPLKATGGNASPDCSGGLQVDFNAWIASGVDLSLVAGGNVCIQAWSRDAGAAIPTNLSNALVFAIGP
jgi:Tol biopolymer transport system component